MTVGQNLDADFFRLIHELQTLSHQSSERRGLPRQAFESVQRVAPCTQQVVPESSQFFEVRCHDLSRRGFSFLLPRRPEMDALVVAFGTAPAEIYVAAKVVNVRNVLIDARGEMHAAESREPASMAWQPMVLVGCEFTERLTR